MSQITRCPQCQTRFKVVDDQLRISDGWVRCGKCKAVFDALTHLVAGAPAAASAGPQAPAVEHAPVAAPAPEAAQPQVAAPAVATPSAEPAQDGAAVLRTENSLQVDPNAQVPELSVLVFPRRANASGDSGYVDSSWMQAYEEEAQAQTPVAPPAGQDRSGLESEWQPMADQRPESLRSSRVDFSATDDLAELQAREGRLLEAIAERQKPTPAPVPPEPAPALLDEPPPLVAEDVVAAAAAPIAKDLQVQ
ncbi:MAG: zinc-ribbon domain-containing protein, partial [Comamonas sp.]|nr:zinc-ribbon domain-containing protein [Comamonas sp.]